MERFRPALAVFILGFWLILPALGQESVPTAGQESLPGIDLLYPQFAHPQRDATVAIKHRDFRFFTMDRIGQVVPGAEQYPHLRAFYGLKLFKPHLHLFASASEKFSFDLRARAYATRYNQALLAYLLAHQRK